MGDLGLWIIGGIVALLIGLLFLATWGMGLEKTRLMEQCQADGHKEYECYSMLRDPTPMVVHSVAPVYVGR